MRANTSQYLRISSSLSLHLSISISPNITLFLSYILYLILFPLSLYLTLAISQSHNLPSHHISPPPYYISLLSPIIWGPYPLLLTLPISHSHWLSGCFELLNSSCSVFALATIVAARHTSLPLSLSPSLSPPSSLSIRNSINSNVVSCYTGYCIISKPSPAPSWGRL